MNLLIGIMGTIFFMIGMFVWSITETTTIEFAFGFMLGGLYLLALKEN